MNLSLLILLPVLTALGVLVVRDAKQVRAVALGPVTTAVFRVRTIGAVLWTWKS